MMSLTEKAYMDAYTNPDRANVLLYNAYIDYIAQATERNKHTRYKFRFMQIKLRGIRREKENVIYKESNPKD